MSGTVSVSNQHVISIHAQNDELFIGLESESPKFVKIDWRSIVTLTKNAADTQCHWGRLNLQWLCEKGKRSAQEARERQEHWCRKWLAARSKQVSRCHRVTGTYNAGIKYCDPGEDRRNKLTGWVDSDFAADP